MNARKLIALIICALLCLSLIPAQASSAMEPHEVAEAGLTISVPESWYVGEHEDGTASELAQALSLDAGTYEGLFVDGLYMIACPDISATSQLQVIVKPDDSVDMRSMSEADKEALIEGGWSAEASGIDVLTCEIYATPYTNYMKTTYKYSGFTAVQYASVFDGNMYMFQYCDYTGSDITPDTIALLDTIVDSVVYGAAAPSPIPGVPAIVQPAVSAEMSVHYASDIGMTISVPDEWYTGMASEGTGAEIAVAFGLSEADLSPLYDLGGGMTCSFYAVTDDYASAQLQVITSEGIPGIDMRDDDIDWDALMEGFLSTYDAADLIESGPFMTPSANYVRAYSSFNGSYALLQYTTNFNGNIYIIQYADYSGDRLDAETIELLDSIVYNIVFD